MNNSIFFKSNEYIPINLKNFILKEMFKNKFNHNTLPDFGNYFNSKILGWGFPNSHTYKIWLHKIFKNKDYYPNSIIINKNFVLNNKKLIIKFINNQRKILKPNKGHSGKNIFIIDNYDKLIDKLDDNFWILQEEIIPQLFNKRKFDIRIFHFILRYENNWYNILSNNGFVKVSNSPYNNSNNDTKGFITNISFNENKNNIKIKYKFFEFVKNENIQNNIFNLIQKYSKDFILQLIKQNKKFNHLKAQIMMLGPDIILNENNDPILIETNCNPAILLKNDLMYNEQKLMIKELIHNIIIPILQNNFNENYSGEQLTIHKIIF